MEGSLFARLSPELRNHVYIFAFDSDFAVPLTHGRTQQGITRTCRQLRTESLEMYYSLARFNAHLDDGPATPLANWLRNIGPKHCLLLRELHIWDIRMLNATLHGQEATERLLDKPLIDGKRYHLQATPKDWLLGRGWYLREIVMALHSIGLELAMFRSSEESSATANMTSRFAIVPLVRMVDRVRWFSQDHELWDLLLHIGFSDDMAHEATTALDNHEKNGSGKREVRVRRGRRDFILIFDGRKLSSIRQTYIPREEDFNWS